ncbi:MAG TPA: hypothetical protein PKA27_03390 [Fimbriimonadaceae bacterium]|nr:hypothetical protein [Fimbriimonadaceae bacterium]
MGHHRTFKLLVTCGLCVACSSAFAASLVYDFSGTSNPNTPWSFGWRNTIGGVGLNLYQSVTTVNGATSGSMIYWRDPALTFAGVYKNVGSVTFNGGEGTIVQPGDVMLHPQHGVVVVARYTTPTTGNYRVLSSVARLGGDSGLTEFYVLADGVTAYNESATSRYTFQPTHSEVLALSAGSVVDFAVDRGDSNLSHDSTGVRAGVYDESLIDQVPADSIATTEGEEFEGTVNSLNSSNDDYYSALSDAVSLSCTIEMYGTTSVTEPTAVWFNYESKSGRFGLVEEVSYFDYVVNAWVQVAGRTASVTDQPGNVTVFHNALRFRGALGQVGARIRWRPINDEDPAQDGWLLSLDTASWEMAR